MDTEMLQWKCSCGATAPATTSHYMSFIAQKAHRGHKVTLVNKDSGEIVALNIKTAEDAGIVLPKGKVKPSKKAAPPPKEETPLDGPSVAQAGEEQPPPATPKAETKAIPEKEEMGEREETPETEEAILESKGAVGAEEEEKGEGDEDEDEDKEAIREGGEESRARIRHITTAGDFTYEITLPADAFMLFNLAKACGLEKNDDLLFDVWVWDCIKARYAKDYKMELVLSPVEEGK